MYKETAKDMYKETAKAVWGVTKVVLQAAVVIGLIGLLLKTVLLPLFVANTAIDTAKGVTKLATDPAVVKRQYETFHARYNGITALTQQITVMRSSTGTDNADQKLINNELRGLQAMCVNEVATYNAQSNQITTGWLLGDSLPKQLDANICK